MIIINENQIECFNLKDEEIKELSNAIESLFSFEIDKPRILFNKNSMKKLNEYLQKKCQTLFFSKKTNISLNDFIKYVHIKECDLGIFFEDEKIVFISGNKNPLSKVKMSVIEKYLNKN